MKFESFYNFLYYFQVIDLKNDTNFTESITHSSSSKKKSYERFEFLGDSILNFCISDILFNKFPNKEEGFLSKQKSYLASRKIAYSVAQDIKIEEVIKVSSHLKKDLNKNVNILSACVESLISLIYIKYGISKASQIIEELFTPYIKNDDKIEDSKTLLQEYTQAKFKQLPIYKLISKTGKDNDPLFTVSAEVMNFNAVAQGKKISEAEKKASLDLYKKLIII